MNEEVEEPGPGAEDLLCRCGCGNVAFYLVESEDDLDGPFKDEPCCTTAMLYLHDCAAELGYKFKATRFPKPEPHTCANDPTRYCLACVKETLLRAKGKGRSPA